MAICMRNKEKKTRYNHLFIVINWTWTNMITVKGCAAFTCQKQPVTESPWWQTAVPAAVRGQMYKPAVRVHQLIERSQIRSSWFIVVSITSYCLICRLMLGAMCVCVCTDNDLKQIYTFLVCLLSTSIYKLPFTQRRCSKLSAD